MHPSHHTADEAFVHLEPMPKVRAVFFYVPHSCPINYAPRCLGCDTNVYRCFNCDVVEFCSGANHYAKVRAAFLWSDVWSDV